MKSRRILLTIVGVLIIAQAFVHDWSDWLGVVYGVLIGAYAMLLFMMAGENHGRKENK